MTAAVWQDQLGILVQSLKECVAEVAERARRSVSFVLLQEAVCSTAQGLQLQQRRDAVFSQAVSDQTNYLAFSLVKCVLKKCVITLMKNYSKLCLNQSLSIDIL